MCGILFFIIKDSKHKKNFEQYILPLIINRGPDSTSHWSHEFTNGYDELITLYFVGTVLHLRGNHTKQPVVSERTEDTLKNVLLWNGEIFGGDLKVEAHENDTQVLFNKLEKFSNSPNNDDIPFMTTLFSSIEGPYAFVYCDNSRKKLWFGRDFFGRRSLLKNKSNEIFCLCSVAHNTFGKEFSEVAAQHLHCIDLSNTQFDDIHNSIQFYPIKISHSHNAPINESFINSKSCVFEHRCTKSLNDLNYENNQSTRISSELISETIDGFSGEKCCSPSSIYSPRDSSSGISVNWNDDDTDLNVDTRYIGIEKITDKFLEILQYSVRRRVVNISTSTEKESFIDPTGIGHPRNARVGILFSGGIDSVVITALAHRCVPLDEPIDLINVAFAQKLKTPQNTKKKHMKKVLENECEIESFDVPDRITGRLALKELPQDRKWNFVEVNVNLGELQHCRSSRIIDLVYPLDTVLDDSIGCAIWFAARGSGCQYDIECGSLKLNEENYKSQAKVLLCGMGADEQLGGYARHRTKFNQSSWKGLEEEIKMETERISTRNLGRDDRCISDHGRESRFPFLDEKVVMFLEQLPVCVKCDPRYPRGIGEKILLREVAQKLGLHNVSKLPKRAIQFGSKIAKLESSKEKGSDSCNRLK